MPRYTVESQWKNRLGRPRSSIQSVEAVNPDEAALDVMVALLDEGVREKTIVTYTITEPA